MTKEQSYRPHRTPAPTIFAPRIEVDLGAVVANWRALGAMSGAAETAAVVKADGYGCRALDVAPALEAAGCRTFFVATLSEAVSLSGALGPEAAIYVLGGFLETGAWPEDPRLRPVLNTLEETEVWAALASANRPAALQIETGMNRLGLTLAEQQAVCASTRLPEDAIGLLMSHLASSDGRDDPLLIAQQKAFDAALPALLARFPGARRSLSATGGGVLGPDLAYDLVRPGVGLFGGLPFAAALPVVRLSAPLIRVWEVGAGERSGYGGDFLARRPSRLATLPLGYADGLPRALAGRWRARIDGKEAPLAGRVSMDLIVLDVTDFDPAPSVGDRAYLLDDVLTVDAMAAAAGAIGYEILTGLDAARRLERRLNPV